MLKKKLYLFSYALSLKGYDLSGGEFGNKKIAIDMKKTKVVYVRFFFTNTHPDKCVIFTGKLHNENIIL